VLSNCCSLVCLRFSSLIPVFVGKHSCQQSGHVNTRKVCFEQGIGFENSACTNMPCVWASFWLDFDRPAVVQSRNVYVVWVSQYIMEQKLVVSSLAPGCSHPRSLIACSMQLQRRKAWEIWSRAFVSGTQMVALPDCNPVLHSSAPNTGNDKQYLCYLVNTLTSNPQMSITRKGFKIFCQAPRG